MRLTSNVPVVVGIVILASACTDFTGTPTRPIASPTLGVQSVRAAIQPNARKYRDSGFQPATGRSGSAAIAVRALLGRSGATDVEITTGSFDDEAAPGALASVQVKAFSHAGSLLATRNHTGLSGGTASFEYAGLSRGAPLQVQAIVRDIDGARSDVVIVTDAVRIRPDLAALALTGPIESPTGTPVNFQAYIAERHGDLGARASCVLYVDGAAVDRADGIWVDAGGVVACAMTHAFATAGEHALEVRVENVRPGDYDDTNNGATSSIRIAEPSDFTAYSVQAWSTEENTTYRDVSTLTLPDGTEETWDQTYTRQGAFQSASINGIIPRQLAYPITLRGEMATNGATIHALDLTHETGEWVDWQQGYCASSFAVEGGGATYVCAYTEGRLAGYTSVQYDWWGADVRYHSDSYVTSWDSSGELHETWLSNDWTQIGPMVTFGPDFRAWVSVQGAGEEWPARAEGTVQLRPFSLDYDYTDPSCSTTPVSTSCRDDHFHMTGVTGFVSFGSWPPFVP